MGAGYPEGVDDPSPPDGPPQEERSALTPTLVVTLIFDDVGDLPPEPRKLQLRFSPLNAPVNQATRNAIIDLDLRLGATREVTTPPSFHIRFAELHLLLLREAHI
ncbi:MAG: hypothetical protein M1815_001855 [Lichina confinis]|nr:MAG: hypothetical protein M1815_001855 [Lichina confinis]